MLLFIEEYRFWAESNYDLQSDYLYFKISLRSSWTISSSDLNTISGFQYKYEQIIGGISTAETGPFIYQTIARPKSNIIYFSK